MPILNAIANLAPAAAVPASAQVFVPNFVLQTQAHAQWCWAAVASSVCAMYGDAGTSQCSLASGYFGDCCVSDPPPDDGWTCNRPNALEIALSDNGHLAAGSPVDNMANPVQFSDIKAQIDANKPVCCGIKLAAGIHYIVIVGYDPATNDLILRDPSPTPLNGSFTLTGLSTFHGGTWSNTYYVAP